MNTNELVVTKLDVPNHTTLLKQLDAAPLRADKKVQCGFGPRRICTTDNPEKENEDQDAQRPQPLANTTTMESSKLNHNKTQPKSRNKRCCTFGLNRNKLNPK